MLGAIRAAALIGGVALAMAPAGALAQGACPEGSFSTVLAPDGSSLSILFDSFTVDGGTPQRACDLQVPLHLPEGFSLGVYRVDYRGFANLPGKGEAELTVVHHLGSDRKGHRFRRKVNGVHQGDFTFTENIGAGLMKRIGCGEAAVLDVSIALRLEGEGGELMAALDSADGASRGGLVYQFDLKKCR